MNFFFLTFFVETETKWSQGPVTRDFWISYSILPRYSAFKHFRVWSASEEIHSAYAQPAMKFVPRMLSVRWNSFRVCSAWIVHVKPVHILPLAEHAWKFVPRMLSVRWNWFLVCSACNKIVSAYAQHGHTKIFAYFTFVFASHIWCFASKWIMWNQAFFSLPSETKFSLQFQISLPKRKWGRTLILCLVNVSLFLNF